MEKRVSSSTNVVVIRPSRGGWYPQLRSSERPAADVSRWRVVDISWAFHGELLFDPSGSTCEIMYPSRSAQPIDLALALLHYYYPDGIQLVAGTVSPHGERRLVHRLPEMEVEY